jgi:hypothetical protein
VSAGLGRAPAWPLTAILGALYVALAPSSADLAAASYRSFLFSKNGFQLWDNGWYAGHHLPAYSVLAPALGALVGVRLLAALSAVLAAALFSKLIDGRFPTRATRLAALWFALGVGIELLSGRVPFELGLALGLAALLALARRHHCLACGLALLSALASPVAGAFLALAALAWAAASTAPADTTLAEGQAQAQSPTASGSVGDGPRRWQGSAVAASALLPILLLALVFPEGGSEPFAASAFWPALAATLLFAALLPRAQSTLRVGTLLYAVALAGAYLLSTPVGGNAVRLGALTAGPLAACVLVGRPLSGGFSRLLSLAVPLLLYWQLVAPVRDLASSARDPAVNASYYTPLIARLDQLQRVGGGSGEGPGATNAANVPPRIEVVPTRDHWEARWMAPRFPLARGWERQLDRSTDAVFYSSRPLTAARYRAWLLDLAVSYVALPAAPLDPSGRAEARLLEHDAAPAGLREVWRSRRWRLFSVRGGRALVEPPARLIGLGSDSFTLAVAHAGEYIVRVRFTPYWDIFAGRGCVRRAAGGWTRIEARSSGSIHVGIHFSLTRIFSRGARCR